ncbi:MAG: hypothetical protein PUA99_11665 [Roseburia hominis]|nr:hypothetical protein [Roseburia hominis]
MVGNGIVSSQCGSGRRKTSFQTRNIVVFGSERGKMPCQTRETVPRRKKKRKMKPAGSGRGKMFIQTRNIVAFGSEREKTPFQTREVDEKKEKEEKNEADRV